jgi:hypothetical protein
MIVPDKFSRGRCLRTKSSPCITLTGLILCPTVAACSPYSNDSPTQDVRCRDQSITRSWTSVPIARVSLATDTAVDHAHPGAFAFNDASGTGSNENQRVEQGPVRITEPEISTGMGGGAGRVRTAASQFCSLPERSMTDEDQQRVVDTNNQADQ